MPRTSYKSPQGGEVSLGKALPVTLVYQNHFLLVPLKKISTQPKMSRERQRRNNFKIREQSKQ